MSDEIEALVERISQTCLRALPELLAIAIGGSRSGGAADTVADLDLVLLMPEGSLIPAARFAKQSLDPLFKDECVLDGGPSWKEGFGCRFSYLYENGFKLEIFVNTPSTVPITNRVSRWRPVHGGAALSLVQDYVAQRLTPIHLSRRIAFDIAYASMSICRHLSRNELFAARHVCTSLVAIALALLLLERNGEYDPFASYKRVYRDGMAADRGVAALIASTENLGSREGVLTHFLAAEESCIGTFERLAKRDPAYAHHLARATRICEACRAWILSAPAAA